MAATMEDVAVRAGVSKSTVSHVLNSTRFVEPETAARVREAIRELAYRPNLLARSLRRRETSTIGLVVPHIASPFWAELIYTVERAARVGGYSLLLANSHWSADQERECLRMLLAKQLDGMLLAPARVSDLMDLSDEIAAEVPLVLVNGIPIHSLVSSVVVDEYRGGYLAGQYLAQLGHRRAGCITSPSGIEACLRAAGFRKALADAGVFLPDAAFTAEDSASTGDVTGVEELLQRDPELTALFIANDFLAMDVLKQLHRMQRRVPEDISVLACNTMITAALWPELTTIVQPIAEIGSAAVRLLIDHITHHCTDQQMMVLQPTLVERESCRAIPTPYV